MNDPAASGWGSDKDFHLKAVASYGKLSPLVGLKWQALKRRRADNILIVKVF